jgi:predicted amidohydrolase YtcJ
MRHCFALYIFLAGLFASGPIWADAPVKADLVITGAKIYVADEAHHIAQAMAVSKGVVVYVGDEAGVKAYIGPKTKREAASGRLVMPGLVDAHSHPTQGIYPLDVCDLHNEAVSLEHIAEIVAGCIKRYHVKDGEWLLVEQWNFGAMTSGTPDFTVRAALDRASRTVPIELLGNDYHHGGYNSAALALATDAQGRKIGLSKASLAREFASYRKLVGVDAAGEPNGTANEDARELMTGKGFFRPATFKAVMKDPKKTAQTLSSDGITAVQDGAVTADTLPLYDALEKAGQLNFRASLALLFQPEDHRLPDGGIDYDAIVDEAGRIRAKYANDPKIKAQTIKIFVDGVLEADPLAVPPTLGESPSLRPYLQPIFGRDAEGNATLKGYVDTGSAICEEVRAHPDAYDSDAAAKQFMAAQGYHPGQCTISSGKYMHDPKLILDYAKRMHDEGYTLHFHAIGNAAVRTALDALEGARAGAAPDRPDTIVHLQMVDPEDMKRLGRDHVYMGYTYSWFYADKAYDLSVIPFIDKVPDDSYESLHNPANEYERTAYPAKSTRDAGGILIAGSDAPVAVRDPQPFVNIAMGITRALPGQKPLNIGEALTIEDLLDAYTRNGAEALGRKNEFGSLEVGKSADFILLDQDVLALAKSGQAEKIAGTRVLATWFQGRKVYTAKP